MSLILFTRSTNCHVTLKVYKTCQNGNSDRQKERKHEYNRRAYFFASSKEIVKIIKKFLPLLRQTTKLAECTPLI